MINTKLMVSAAVAISAMLGIGDASAADLAARPFTKAPIYGAPPISWTGCYIGGNIGGGWDRFSAGEVAFAGVPTPFVDYGSNNGTSGVDRGPTRCPHHFPSDLAVCCPGPAQ